MCTVQVVRGGGRHELERGETEPQFRVSNCWELLDILRDTFGVVVPPEAARMPAGSPAEKANGAEETLGRPDGGVAQ